MKLDRVARLAIAIAVVAVFIIAAGALLFVTESALNIWDRLRAGPAIFLYLYVAIMLLLAATAILLIVRLVVRKPRETKTKPTVTSSTDIKKRLAEAEIAGVDTARAQSELQELAARQADGAIHLCFYGEVSTGKSSLIKTLIPEAEVLIDVVAGSTEEVRHYRWRNAHGVEIVLTDVPGHGGHEVGLDEAAADEAKRAHVVLFVCDGDLSRSELAAITALLSLEKPLILVLNKADRYSLEEQAVLMQQFLRRIEDLGGEPKRDQVVAVSAGGVSEVVQRAEDGRETLVKHDRPADIGVLTIAINSMLTKNLEGLDAKRERAVFQIAADKLESAEAEYRQQRAEQIIRSSTRKAIVGALAAVSPGTDILIQGYIGTAMTRELCQLFGAAPKDLDVEAFLSMSQSRVGRALPLTLAVAGNGLKAFPGVGTVAGGLVHAVAYGLIFDALGRSLVLTLSRHGELFPEAAANEFKEGISEHLEAGVRRVAKMALEEKTR